MTSNGMDPVGDHARAIAESHVAGPQDEAEWSDGISHLFASTSLTPPQHRPGTTMPSLAGTTEWLNSGRLDPADLRGRAVLVNFFTLTCINWLRQAPYVRAWSQAYRDDGLVVIGVHTPEFSFEREIDRVRRATRELEIDYPVAVDNGYDVWNAFHNHYWPALYFVDADGTIRDCRFGEGRYAESERTIQRLLGIERDFVSVTGSGIEAEADWDNLRTPETHLGYGRSGRMVAPAGASLESSAAYQLPEHLRLDEWALAGEWTISRERVVLDEAGGRIALRFHARDAHLVLFPGARKPVSFRVLLDGRAPGSSHGVDIEADGTGVARDGGIYQLVRERNEVRERTVEIEFFEQGAEAYAFTFG